MIYDKSGNIITAYEKSGSAAQYAYDKSGNLIYPSNLNIKVMTYNVGGWYEGTGTNVPANKKEQYYALQTGIIEDNDPDILLIEEYLASFSADGTSALTMLQGLFPYVYAVPSGTYYGRAICSKYPIANYTTRTYANDSSRYYDSWTITIHGVPITAVVTHLGLTPEARAPQITQLVTYLSTLQRFVCGGDYNTPHSGLGTPIDKSELQPFITAGFNLANCSVLGDFVTKTKTNGWEGWIDNISSSANIVPISAYIDNTKNILYSAGEISEVDHVPFIVTLEVT